MKNWRVLIIYLGIFTGLLGDGKVLSSQTNSHRQPNPASAPLPHLESKAAEQQAQQLYEAGQYAEARRMLQQIAADSAAKGDELGQAMALRNLSLVYQKTGELSEAKQAIADRINRLEKSDSSRQRTRLLALTLESQGQLELSLG